MTQTPLHRDIAAVDAILADSFPLAQREEHLGIKVGPVALSITIPTGFLEPLMRRYKGFLWNGPYDFYVEVLRSEVLDLKDYPNIRVHSLVGGRVHYVFRWDFLARIDTAARSAVIILTPMGSALGVDCIARIACSFVAVERGGFLLHSATIGTAFGGFVFCSVSGGGKSTIGKVSLGLYDVITDEMSMLERKEDGYLVWGTPFWGELQISVNRSVPLRAVFIIEKAKHNAVCDISVGEAVAGFMQTILYFGQNLEVCNTLMATAIDFSAQVPIKRLQFLPNASLWEAIKNEFGN